MARRPRRCRTAPQTSGRRRIALSCRDRRARGRRAIAGKLSGIRVIIAFEGKLWASIKRFHYSFSLLPGWARVRSRRVGDGESTLITSLTWLSLSSGYALLQRSVLFCTTASRLDSCAIELLIWWSQRAFVAWYLAGLHLLPSGRWSRRRRRRP